MSTTSMITRPPGSLMHDPPHPGEVLREGWLTPLGLSVTAAAEHFGIARKTLSEILNGQAGISAPMALRLSQALGTTAEQWLTLQAHYDLWQARRHADSRAEVEVALAADHEHCISFSRARGVGPGRSRRRASTESDKAISLRVGKPCLTALVSRRNCSPAWRSWTMKSPRHGRPRRVRKPGRGRISGGTALSKPSKHTWPRESQPSVTAHDGNLDPVERRSALRQATR